MLRILLLLYSWFKDVFFVFLHVSVLPPCEVDADVGPPTADLCEGERGNITPDFQGLSEDTSNLLLVHLPGKPDNPVGDRRRCETHTHTHTGCRVEGDHRPRGPPSNLISAVVSSAGRCAVTNALRHANKTLHHGLLPFLLGKTTQYDEWKKRRETSLSLQQDAEHFTNYVEYQVYIQTSNQTDTAAAKCKIKALHFSLEYINTSGQDNLLLRWTPVTVYLSLLLVFKVQCGRIVNYRKNTETLDCEKYSNFDIIWCSDIYWS